MRRWRAKLDCSELERALVWLRALEYSVANLSDLASSGSFDLLTSLGSKTAYQTC